MITNILIFVLVLGMLIFFHELGHFLAARFFGVGIEKFSLGFGPRLFGYRIGITDYRISAIPLGGYVKMIGGDLDTESDNDMSELSFANKHIFKKFLIVLAGPLFNIVFAFILFFTVFYSSGIFVLKPIIGEVISGMPASSSGLKSGDNVTSIDQKLVNKWTDIVEIISTNHGAPLEVKFNRNGTYSTVFVDPVLVESKNIFGQKINKYAIGITSSGDVVSKKLSFMEAISNSFSKTYGTAYLTVSSIIKLIQGAASSNILGGPIMIAEIAGYHARAGIIDLIFFIALLSVNLGILNCLPIPVLDGGHLSFFLLEAILGRPVNVKFRELANQFGAFILLILMGYIIYNDITRLFSN